MSNGPGLDFEIEIAELESRIQELERQTEERMKLKLKFVSSALIWLSIYERRTVP